MSVIAMLEHIFAIAIAMIQRRPCSREELLEFSYDVDRGVIELRYDAALALDHITPHLFRFLSAVCFLDKRVG